MQVSYQSEPLLGFLVPAGNARGLHDLGSGTTVSPGPLWYGNFRQFTVRADEAIEPPKGAP